jgi:hypothetical protein
MRSNGDCSFLLDPEIWIGIAGKKRLQPLRMAIRAIRKKAIGLKRSREKSYAKRDFVGLLAT